MITTRVTGKVKAPDGTAVENAEVVAKLSAYDYDTAFGWIENRKTTTTTDADGDFSFELWPNTRGTEGTNYRVVIRSPKPGVSTSFTATIPEQNTVDLITAADFDPVPELSDAEQLVIEAQGYVQESRNWATSLDVVDSGLYGARYYAQQSAVSSSNASDSELNAANSVNTVLESVSQVVNSSIENAIIYGA